MLYTTSEVLYASSVIGSLFVDVSFVAFDLGSIWDQLRVDPRSLCVSLISVSTDFIFSRLRVSTDVRDLLKTHLKNSLHGAFYKLARLT